MDQLYKIVSKIQEDELDRVFGERAWIRPISTRNLARLNSLVLREQFRQAVRDKSKLSNYYVVDMTEHICAENIVGCYKEGGGWIVYENDDHGNPSSIFRFYSQKKAYKKAATLGSFRFKPNSISLFVAYRFGVFSQEYVKYAEKALHRCMFLAENFDGEATGEQAGRDARFIEGFLKGRSKAKVSLFNTYLANTILPIKWTKKLDSTYEETSCGNTATLR